MNKQPSCLVACSWLVRVLLLIADEANGIYNRVSREGGSAGLEDLRAFQELVSRLRRLERERLVDIDVQLCRETLSSVIPDKLVSAGDMLSAVKDGYRMEYQAQPAGYVLTGERTHYVVAVDKLAWGQPDFEAVRRTLKLSPRQETYELDASTSPESNGLRLATRSVLGAMLYLSNAVTVPKAHHGLVGPNVDLNSPMKKLLEVRVSASLVDDAYVAVQHRGYWFYVDDEDIESKRTLGLLTSLVRLNISAVGAQNVPILTLPVSR